MITSCGEDREVFLAQDQATKDSLHLRGLEWLETEYKRLDKMVLFGTHASVVINGTPTAIVTSRDLEYVTDIIYLDYDIDTVMKRQEGDQIRQRNHPRSRVEDWISLERNCLKDIEINYPSIRIHTLKPDDDLMQIFHSILNLNTPKVSPYLSPVGSKKCGEIFRFQPYPYLIDLSTDARAVSGVIHICRCGQCHTFPYALSTCEFPLVATSEKYGQHLKVCGCGKSKGRLCGRPWCDGSHTLLPDIEDLTQNQSCQGSPFISSSLSSAGQNHHLEFSLSQELKGQFMSDGYCILHNMIPSHLVHCALKSINMALSQGLISNSYPPDFVNTTMRPTPSKKLFTTTSVDILNLFTPMLPLCNHLLGAGNFFLPTQAQLALRFPTNGTPRENYFEDSIDWHVDDIFDAPLPPFSLLIGIPLNEWKDSYCGNFTLYAGSHHTINRFIVDDYQSFVDNYKFAKHPKLPNPIQIVANLNDAFIVHPLVAHQVAPNYSPFVRYAVYFRIETKYKQFLQRRILSDIWLEFPGLRQSRKTAMMAFLLQFSKDVQTQYHDFPSEKLFDICDLLSNLFLSKEQRISSLSCFEGLEDLDLSGLKLGDGGAWVVAKALQLNPPLKTLRLECNNIGDKGAEYLASALFKNTNLTKLDLFNNNIGNAGAISLAKVISSTRLRMVDLWGNLIENDGCISLAKVMTTGEQPGLSDLLLNANSLQEDILPILRQIFPNIVPSKLYIEDCKLGDYESIMSYSHGQALLHTLAPLEFAREIGFSNRFSLSSIQLAESSFPHHRPEVDRNLALTDAEVQKFICDGIHITRDNLTPETRNMIVSKLDRMYSEYGNAGNNVCSLIPELGWIWSSCSVKAVVTSLLGNNWIVHPHRHSHLGTINRPPQTWHRDSTFGYRLQRFPYPTMLLAFYYPHDVSEDCGPTELLLGSQYYHRPEGERLCRLPHRLYLEQYKQEWNVHHYSIIPCTAGTIALVHPDIWHRGGRNSSAIFGDGKQRHMVKFILERTEFPTNPTWNCQSREFSLHHEIGADLRLDLWKNIWTWMQGRSSNNSLTTETSAEVIALFEELLHSSSISSQLQSASQFATIKEGFDILSRAFYQDTSPLTRIDVFNQSYYGILQSSDPQFLQYLTNFLLMPHPNDISDQQIWIERAHHTLILLGFKLPHYVDDNLVSQADLQTATQVLIHYSECSIPVLRLSAVRALGWQQWLALRTTPSTVDHIFTALLCRISPQTESTEYVQTYASSSLLKLLLCLPPHFLSQTSRISEMVSLTLIPLITSSPSVSYSHRYTVAYSIESLSYLAKYEPKINEFLVNYLKITRWCPYTHPKSSY